MEEPTLTEVPADLSLLQVMIMMHRLMSMELLGSKSGVILKMYTRP
uniref:Uncharacterized protein n=1 Tax=Medicago truncatula TaxID=3880 RepID=I3SMR0_MEDTR|nr:unknown [Medicago truncatula]